MEFAPIVLFVYNRPWHTQQTVEALQRNELASESILFVYSDAPKNENEVENVKKVREYIKSMDRFKKVTIIERKVNLGLADSVIDGVTKIVNEYGRVIVLEDDLVTSPYFLRFMNEGLNFYYDNNVIMSISGYNLPKNCMKFPHNFTDDIYLNYRNSSWGWATWSNRWSLVDWDIKDYQKFVADQEQQKKFNRGGDDLTDLLKLQMTGIIDSWSIRFSYAHFKQRMYSICPRHSYVNNIGCDGTGQHCGVTKMYENNLSEAVRNCTFKENIQLNATIIKEFKKAYRKKNFAEQGINRVSMYFLKREFFK